MKRVAALLIAGALLAGAGAASTATSSPTRTLTVTTAAAWRTAVANLQPGDLVQAGAPFTVTGETKIANRLAAPAELDLSHISFVYSGTANLPAVWVDNAQNLVLKGGDLTTSDTGGTCLLDYGSQHVTWWGFNVHDCGGSGVFVTPIGAPVAGDDFEGSITKVGQHLAWDPHTEKGSGLHGALLWDSGNSQAFTGNVFAFDEHAIPVGACVEIGNSVAAAATGNVLFLTCSSETFVSTVQTGGNGVQLWGKTTSLGLDIRYLDVTDAQGRALDAQGVSTGQSLAGVTVDYGRAFDTNQNAHLAEPANTLPWDTRGGTTYLNVR